jgi:hypothetical protein
LAASLLLLLISATLLARVMRYVSRGAALTRDRPIDAEQASRATGNSDS